MKDKIFFIGPPKSGSKSFAYALTELGFKVTHDYVAAASSILSNNWDYFRSSEFDIFCDGMLTNFHGLIDNFPNSKYIVSYRNPHDIAFSRFNHAFHAKKNGQPCPDGWGQYQTIVKELEEFYSYVFYLALNSKYDINVVKLENGWSDLCPALNVAIPEVPFPHKNKKENLDTIMSLGTEPCPSQVSKKS